MPLGNRGFTLLEVMIATGIIAIGIGSILVAQNNSLDVTVRAKRMTTVAMLAKNAMIQTEREIEGKPFAETKTEASGAFEAPYAEYRWERKIKEIQFPNIMDSQAAKQEGLDQNVERIVKLATNYLSKASREITITISWVEKKETQTFTVSQYWVDLNHAFQLNE